MERKKTTTRKGSINNKEIIKENINNVSTGNIRSKNNNIMLKRKKRTLTIILVFFIALFIYCSIYLVYWLVTNHRSKKIEEDVVEIADIKDTDGDVTENVNEPDDSNSKRYIDDYFYYMNLPFMSVEFSKLKEKNPDTIAWLKVPGTNVNYPVVQTTDNDYYLTHAFDGSYNAAGWIFADYRCNFNDFGRNNIIYGHSRRNNTMFGSLLGTLNSSWYQNRDNTILYLSTEKYNTIWQVFSVYTIDKNAEYLTTYFIDDNSYTNFLNTMKGRSVYDFSAEVNSKDRILTLSTCAANDNYRVVVQAKLIRRDIRN